MLISRCMSGNTDFWRNDLFTRTGHPVPGSNLFGADRVVACLHAFLDSRADALIMRPAL
jgi:hypothetical protein